MPKTPDSSAFQIRAKGSLNEKPFSLNVDGPSLRDLTPASAYTFTATVAAADIDLHTRIRVLKPFDLSQLDVGFAITGHDLADVYYLTGLALPNTPPYRLQATVQARGTAYTLNDLHGRLGSSDLSGQFAVETGGKIPKLTARLHSNALQLVDLAPTLGVPTNPKERSPAVAAATNTPGTATAASRATPPSPVTDEQKLRDRLLPDSRLQLDRVRGMDADVRFVAGSVIVPHLPMQQVRLHLMLENGVLTLDPLSFVLDQGTFTGTVRIDAREDQPKSTIDMRLENVDLSQFKASGMQSPPLTGALLGRLQLTGRGDSVHQFAASSHGAISIVIPQGEINAGIAELTGIDVTRGLGLLLVKPQKHDEVRCGVLDFQAQDGVLRARTLFVDTTDVLISGEGDIDLQNEKLDLELKGSPKHIRFTRLRSPITVDGTLAHPAIGVDVKKLATQAGVATALGTLLTPVAAVFAFIDPGTAKNKDCGAALAQTGEPLASVRLASPTPR